MNIHQISVTYLQEQDRCLVRINSRSGEEMRLWFTRRLTLGLLPHLHETAAAQLRQHTLPGASAAPMEQRRTELLASFQREATAYSGDYRTPFKAEAVNLPLGDEPLLITEVKLALGESGKLDLQLIETTATQVRNIALAMNTQLVQGLLHLLGEALKLSQWLDAPAASAAPAPHLGNDTPGLADGTERPRYLN